MWHRDCCARNSGIADASGHALNRLRTGVVLVDGSARVLFANEAAERMFRASGGLTVHGGKLTASRGRDTTALRALIGKAARTTAGDSLHPGGVLALSRPQSHRPLGVLVTPVPAGGSGLDRERTAAVLVANPDEPQFADPDVLRALFGLTSAECRLVLAIGSGLSLTEAAASLGIARGTATSHLKRAVEKTGTARQPELVAVVSRLAGIR